jgi:hypothetical protein
MHEPEEKSEEILSFWRAWALALLLGALCTVAITVLAQGSP